MNSENRGDGDIMVDPDNDSGMMFDAYYYAHGCGDPYERSEEWKNVFSYFADHIVSDIMPSTVLDAGCAMGFLVEALRLRDVQAYGIDISEYAIENIHPEIKPYCWQGSIADPFPQQYDLIITIEVLEHMPKTEAEKALINLCQHSNDILFSSTPYDYKEITHLNVHPPEYWGELFARQSFYRDVDFDASFITPWAVRFRRKNEPIHRIISDYERRFWPVWKENADLRTLVAEMRVQLSNDSQKIDDLEKQSIELNNQLDKAQSTLDQITNSKYWHWLQRIIHLHD